MSAEGEAIRSNDYRKDTTVKAPSTRPAAVLGLDVGKSSHWACLIDRDGEVLASAPVRNREAELDALFASAPAGTLVVDQFRNIGSLAVRRARAAGLGVAYLPGLAASRAAGLFAGEAKTDERDAAVIARTALGVPDSLSGVPGRGEALEAARALSSQRDHVVACATRDKNRLRAVLLESCPALEAAVDLSDRRWLELLTVPGIGPRTAAQLAVSVDIGRFPDHDHLASYCGIAPRVRSSGTSVRSVRASRRGDARLKSLLIFSCNSLVRSSGRYGEYYRACRARGMGGLATLMWTVPGGAQETGGPYMRDPRHPRHFTDEFKRQIVDLYNAGKPKREIMDEYDLGKSTVERWIKSINATGSPRAACNRTPEQNRILELERENRRLRMEVDVLKQAALIYARK